jgi:hypothetical protein
MVNPGKQDGQPAGHKTVTQIAEEGWGKGDVVVSHDGTEWDVDHAIGTGVYVSVLGGNGVKHLIKWNEIAKHTKGKEAENEAVPARAHTPPRCLDAHPARHPAASSSHAAPNASATGHQSPSAEAKPSQKYLKF